MRDNNNKIIVKPNQTLILYLFLFMIVLVADPAYFHASNPNFSLTGAHLRVGK